MLTYYVYSTKLIHKTYVPTSMYVVFTTVYNINTQLSVLVILNTRATV